MVELSPSVELGCVELTRLENGIPGRQKSTFLTSAFLRFSSRTKSSRSSSGHMQHVWKRCHKGASIKKWLAKFKNGNLDLEDTPQSGRLSEFNEEHLKALLKGDGRQTARELAEKIKCSAVTISNHHQSISFSQKL
ncbi:hypothetical protein LAZ67_9002195 [Cordylochernes scorpioides]|uniref:Transposase n=1 Tax=Cordylochernes scorpioides TaxID=51811 RepID=A0ABY6KYL5_9ARAC|nr:hypothetical protein LAZ67_9002195 [Cordylochernes scorpioides]